MKLEYNDEKLWCIDFLILLITVWLLILRVYLSYDCYTAPTIQEAPWYCLMLRW